MDEDKRQKEDSKRGGRPAGVPDSVRRKTIGVRVNLAEWNLLKNKANIMGMNPAQWLRVAALKRQLPPQPIPEANRSAYAELGRLAVNVNQIAKGANEGRAVVSSDLLLGVKQEIMRLQSALLGIKE